MYRFLLTPRWLGILALALVAAAVMGLLGNWQLSRYHERSAINNRIDTSAKMAPVPLNAVMATAGDRTGSAGQAPPKSAAWTRLTASGRYDDANTILVRSRTVDSTVGFEVVTPLVLTDGSALLVDRGWVPPVPGSAIARPKVPPAPTGPVTVVGRVHLSESRPDPVQRTDGRLETRRIAVPRIAASLPYRVYGAYVLLDEQTPANDSVFSTIPIDHEDAWQNAGYVVQWWLFGLMTLYGFVWAARREARGDDDSDEPKDRAAEPAPVTPV